MQRRRRAILQVGAHLELLLRVGGADHGGAGDARLALEAVELAAEDVEVDRRVDDEPLRPVVDERAVPARTNELGRLRGAERPGIRVRTRGERRLVGADDREPVVVVGALCAVGRRAPPEGAAERERRSEPVAVDAHECMPEPVHAAVAAVPRAGVRADLGRVARPPRVDRRRHARDET